MGSRLGNIIFIWLSCALMYSSTLYYYSNWQNVLTKVLINNNIPVIGVEEIEIIENVGTSHEPFGHKPYNIVTQTMLSHVFYIFHYSFTLRTVWTNLGIKSLSYIRKFTNWTALYPGLLNFGQLSFWFNKSSFWMIIYSLYYYIRTVCVCKTPIPCLALIKILLRFVSQK